MKKIKNRIKELLYIIPTLYFNFHYLPFHQAVHLPILLYKPRLKKMKGSVQIKVESNKLYYGMIRLGFYDVSVYPNSGIMWENNGGKVVFLGKCRIGNDTNISLGEKTEVEIGNDLISSAGLRMISYRGVKIGAHARLGWGVLLMDTNIHPLYDITNKRYKKASGKIEIGDYNWFGTQCKIMHSVVTPERCIFGMNSIVTRGSEMKSFCVMGGSPVRVLTENVMRDYNNDTEEI